MIKKYFKIILNRMPLKPLVHIYYLRSKFYAMLYKKRYSVKLLRELNFENYKKSDTLFILGGGTSINDYSEKEWKLIGDNDSFGINFWPIHDFIPTYHCFEQGRKEGNHISPIIRLLGAKKSLYKNTPLVIKDLEVEPDLGHFPEELLCNLYISVEVVIPGETLSDFRKNLKHMIGSGYFKKNNTKLLFRRRATVAYLIMLGFVMGYKNIVLCGIDIANKAYFYEEKREYYKKKGLEIPDTGQAGDVHTTIDSGLGVPIDKIIYAIDELLLKPDGVNLYIGSKKSLLYPKLPYYFEK